jgi:hypothetical protein
VITKQLKEEWSINFIVNQSGDGIVTFSNEEFNLFFDFDYDPDDNDPSISELSGTRIAFPKYVERRPFYSSADLLLATNVYELELAEDINAIAFKTLEERMLEELGKGLLRVAIKKYIEKQVRKEDETWGMIVSAINFASEQADTRNWQTLPYNIHYGRVPLAPGENKLLLRTEGARGESVQDFTFMGQKGKTQFQTYQSLESEITF